MANEGLRGKIQPLKGAARMSPYSRPPPAGGLMAVSSRSANKLNRDVLKGPGSDFGDKSKKIEPVSACESKDTTQSLKRAENTTTFKKISKLTFWQKREDSLIGRRSHEDRLTKSGSQRKSNDPWEAIMAAIDRECKALSANKPPKPVSEPSFMENLLLANRTPKSVSEQKSKDPFANRSFKFCNATPSWSLPKKILSHRSILKSLRENRKRPRVVVDLDEDEEETLNFKPNKMVERGGKRAKKEEKNSDDDDEYNPMVPAKSTEVAIRILKTVSGLDPLECKCSLCIPTMPSATGNAKEIYDHLEELSKLKEQRDSRK